MKIKLLIVSFWILALICAFSFKGHSQDTTKHLIADETQLTYLKTGAKITTTLGFVFQDISLKFGTEFKKVTITYRHANGQPYKAYVMLVSETTTHNISKWAKKNL